MKTKLAVAVAAAIAAGGALTAQAHEAGDIIIRAGIVNVDPSGDSDSIVLPTEPATVLPGGVDVDDDTQLSIIGTWMVTDVWGVELLAATPFEHDITQPDLGIDAGSTKHLPPTLSLQYYPRGGKAGWQPYVGIGVNYTYFFDEEVDPALGEALGAVLGATSARLDLDDSIGLAGQAGVDIPLNDNWMLNAGVWYIDIGTTADVVTDVGTVSFDVDIDPWVYNIGIAYKF
ncbi:OmpW family outer membrane protein [Pseudohaliea sp.]|uniref:OmpW/AlkL family protein n=1 Tax=Pseudohaliea sp. TaxID=2740289 RepID=UPI0032ED8EE0